MQTNIICNRSIIYRHAKELHTARLKRRLITEHCTYQFYVDKASGVVDGDPSKYGLKTLYRLPMSRG